MSTLEDRLHGLADAPADPATPPEPDQLWRRGRRWQLRRRVGTWVGAALVLGVVGALAWPGLQSASLQPAAGADQVGLPRVAWVNTSEHLGELERGPVVAVASATRRGWGATRMGLLGISATTGEYGFLPVDHLGDPISFAPVLSPDGRYVAYAGTGLTDEQGVGPREGEDPVTQLRVLDTRTGRTAVHSFGAAHGLSELNLLWSDDDTVVATPWEWQDTQGHTARRGTAISWRQGSDPVDTRPLRPGQLYWVTDSSGWRAALDGDQLTVRGPGQDSAKTLLSQGVFGVLGWRDGKIVVAFETPVENTGRVGEPTSLVRLVNPRSGAQESFLEVRSQGEWSTSNTWSFASGLLADAPVVNRPEPPRPASPWRTVGGSSLALVIGAAGIILWRRRARP